MEHGITWAHLLLGPVEHWMVDWGIDPVPAMDALVASVALILLAWIGGMPFRSRSQDEPKGKVNFAFLMELVVGGLLKFFAGILHHHGAARKFYVYLATVFLFILANNLLGLIPGFNPPTDQFNVTVTLGVLTFLIAHAIGVKEHGFGYIKKFMGPVWYMAPLLFPIELISHLVRPLSLAMRLFGNMTGDHKVVAVFTSLLALGLPIPFLGLGLFVACLQAFVFVLLTCVYFQDALDHAH
ncbi:MAG TPA: F0F1 ATP synthase subunit A [bacterium]